MISESLAVRISFVVIKTLLLIVIDGRVAALSVLDYFWCRMLVYHHCLICKTVERRNIVVASLLGNNF